MQGNLWLDTKQSRLAGISGRLTREVKFAGGFLGHLDPGGTFEVKQAEVVPGCWEMMLLNVHMKGRALFFKSIAVDERYSRSELKRVPDDLTAAKGAEMLEKLDGKNQAATLSLKFASCAPNMMKLDHSPGRLPGPSWAAAQVWADCEQPPRIVKYT